MSLFVSCCWWQWRRCGIYGPKSGPEIEKVTEVSMYFWHLTYCCKMKWNLSSNTTHADTFTFHPLLMPKGHCICSSVQVAVCPLRVQSNCSNFYVFTKDCPLLHLLHPNRWLSEYHLCTAPLTTFKLLPGLMQPLISSALHHVPFLLTCFLPSL